MVGERGRYEEDVAHGEQGAVEEEDEAEEEEEDAAGGEGDADFCWVSWDTSAMFASSVQAIGLGPGECGEVCRAVLCESDSQYVGIFAVSFSFPLRCLSWAVSSPVGRSDGRSRCAAHRQEGPKSPGSKQLSCEGDRGRRIGARGRRVETRRCERHDRRPIAERSSSSLSTFRDVELHRMPDTPAATSTTTTTPSTPPTQFSPRSGALATPRCPNTSAAYASLPSHPPHPSPPL